MQTRFMIALVALAWPSAVRAQSQFAPRFAPPVQVMAGKDVLGSKRMYPSPVFFDVDQDGRLDVVVGDLPGKLTKSLRLPGDGVPRFGKEEPFAGADGKALKFHNW